MSPPHPLSDAPIGSVDRDGGSAFERRSQLLEPRDGAGGVGLEERRRFLQAKLIDPILGERARGGLEVAGLGRFSGAGLRLISLPGDAHEAPDPDGAEGDGGEEGGQNGGLLAVDELLQQLPRGVLVGDHELARLEPL